MLESRFHYPPVSNPIRQHWKSSFRFMSRCSSHHGQRPDALQIPWTTFAQPFIVFLGSMRSASSDEFRNDKPRRTRNPSHCKAEIWTTGVVTDSARSALKEIKLKRFVEPALLGRTELLANLPRPLEATKRLIESIAQIDAAVQSNSGIA